MLSLATLAWGVPTPPLLLPANTWKPVYPSCSGLCCRHKRCTNISVGAAGGKGRKELSGSWNLSRWLFCWRGNDECLPYMWKAGALVAGNVVSNCWPSQVGESYSGRKGQGDEMEWRGECVWECACISGLAKELWKVHKPQKFLRGFEKVSEQRRPVQENRCHRCLPLF